MLAEWYKLAGLLNEYYVGNGQSVYIVAEKYGDTLSSGYAVYLTATDPRTAKEVWTSRGWVKQYVALKSTYAVVVATNKYLNTALNTLSNLRPTYR